MFCFLPWDFQLLPGTLNHQKNILKNIINYIFRVMQNIFTSCQIKNHFVSFCYCLWSMHFFCGEIFFCLCCVYKCVAHWAVSKFSFYSVVSSGVPLEFLITTPCVSLDPGTTQNNEQRSHQPIISEGTISSSQADSTKSSQFHQSKPRLFLPPTMFHQSSKLGEKRKFQL